MFWFSSFDDGVWILMTLKQTSSFRLCIRFNASCECVVFAISCVSDAEIQSRRWYADVDHGTRGEKKRSKKHGKKRMEKEMRFSFAETHDAKPLTLRLHHLMVRTSHLSSSLRHPFCRKRRVRRKEEEKQMQGKRLGITKERMMGRHEKRKAEPVTD